MTSNFAPIFHHIKSNNRMQSLAEKIISWYLKTEESRT